MRMLHLSDLHFRSGVVGTNLDPYRAIRNEILRDVESLVGRLGQIDAILISGDIAFAGRPDEYAFARDWLDQLCARSGAPITGVFVCPGNHDVDRQVTNQPDVRAIHDQIVATDAVQVENLLSGMLTHPRTARALYEPLDAYNSFAGQFLCDLLPPDRTLARRDITLNDGSMELPQFGGHLATR